MGVIGWVLLGLMAGAIAKAIHPGDHEPSGMIAFAVGILGAVLGGFVASALGAGALGSFFSLGTWLIAILGALLLLAIYNTVAGADRRGAGQH